uniref:hypothetical protein n=1 Tax=Escherichia coli TaxID=562 RepID=UPI001954B847
MFARLALAVALVSGSILASEPAHAAPELVALSGGYSPGTIIVRTSERRLYLVLGGGAAVRYK